MTARTPASSPASDDIKRAAKIASQLVNRKDKELYDIDADEFVPNPFYQPPKQ